MPKKPDISYYKNLFPDLIQSNNEELGPYKKPYQFNSQEELMQSFDKDLTNELKLRGLDNLEHGRPEGPEQELPLKDQGSLQPNEKQMALEAFLSQQREPPAPPQDQMFDKQKFHDSLMPNEAQMEEAMNMAGGAMGGLGKVGNIIKRELPKRFSNLIPTKAQEFFDAITKAKSANPKIGEFVHPYNVDELAQMKTYLHPDKLSGYGIKPDGDLVSVFSSAKGRGDELVKDALSKGASKLDAFEGYLTNKLYPKHGFKEVRREANYTPGQPDVVYMAKPESTGMMGRLLPGMSQSKRGGMDVGQIKTKLNEVNNTLGSSHPDTQFLQRMLSKYIP